jgi:hypothetical protein
MIPAKHLPIPRQNDPFHLEEADLKGRPDTSPHGDTIV